METYCFRPAHPSVRHKSLYVQPLLHFKKECLKTFHCCLLPYRELHIITRGPSIYFKSTSTSLFTGSTFYQNLKNFLLYLIQHSLKSGGTKDQFMCVKVPGTPPLTERPKLQEFHWVILEGVVVPFYLEKFNKKGGGGIL